MLKLARSDLFGGPYDIRELVRTAPEVVVEIVARRIARRIRQGEIEEKIARSIPAESHRRGNIVLRNLHLVGREIQHPVGLSGRDQMSQARVHIQRSILGVLARINTLERPV